MDAKLDTAHNMLNLLPAGEFNIVREDKHNLYVKLAKGTVLQLPKKDILGAVEDAKNEQEHERA